MKKNEFITQEITKILEVSQRSTLGQAKACAWILANFKGLNIKILKVKDLNPLADYFILASAQNEIQAKAMAQEISAQLKGLGFKLASMEGTAEGHWVLLDFVDVIVHIFLDIARPIYDLDKLWREAPQIKVPESYYYSAGIDSENEGEREDSNSPNEYF